MHKLKVSKIIWIPEILSLVTEIFEPISPCLDRVNDEPHYFYF